METSKTNEVPMADANYVAADAQPKRGHIFCGYCCDVRTACLVVNMIALAFAGLGLVSLAPKMDRPGFQRFGIFMAAFVLGIIANSLGIYGALKFKQIFVLIAGVWFALEALLSLILFLDFVGFALGLLFLYPHIMLFKEIQDGIMTKENYVNEKSCCGSL
mmetsp:Transcript_12391/g.35275  ORF Transcript_12391/g.35275 Transcript_12391/m.35275 type:complete len:161 (+) Transcript_12391:86-568(+)